MSESKKYTCAICGHEYDHLEDRNACETKCLRERKEAEEKRKQEALNKTRAARKKEVDEAYERYAELLSKYVQDYGYCRFKYRDDGIDWIWKSPLGF